MPNYEGPGIYKHYKGAFYEVLGLAVREETVVKDDHVGEWPAGATPEGVTVVVYRPLSPGSMLEDRPERFWTRELSDFNDERVPVGRLADLARRFEAVSVRKDLIYEGELMVSLDGDGEAVITEVVGEDGEGPSFVPLTDLLVSHFGDEAQRVLVSRGELRSTVVFPGTYRVVVQRVFSPPGD